MLRRIYCIIFALAVISCTSKKQQKNNVTNTKIDMNTEKKHADFTSLNKKSEKETKDWKEYADLKEFLKEFKNISATSALDNALELKKLTQQLKDSSDIEIMRIPALKARVNVFENEVLRLADMTYIPAISAKEVSVQVEKTLALFGSFNAKINNIYIKREFDSDIELDSLFKE